MTGQTLPTLPFPLVDEGAPHCEHKLREDGALVMTGAPKTDMFIDPGTDGSGTLPDAGRLVGVPPTGDFTLSAKVTVGFTTVYDAAALVVDAGERLWAKLCFEYSPQRRPTAVTVVTRGKSDDCNSFEIDGDTWWFRITRKGDAWAFHGSTDGSWWTMLRYFSLGEREAGREARVGFLAQSPTGESCTAVFEHIAFEPGAPADLRDGS